MAIAWQPPLSGLAASFVHGDNIANLSLGTFAIKRALSFSVATVGVKAQQYVKMPTLNFSGLDPATTELTFGISFDLSSGDSLAKVKLGEFLNAEAVFALKSKAQVAFETKLTVEEFLDDYVDVPGSPQPTLAEGLADLFIPYWSDTLWQKVYGTALSLVGPIDLYSGRNDTPLANAEVVVLDESNKETTRGRTNAEGQFTTPLIVGTYRATVSLVNYHSRSLPIRVSGEGTEFRVQLMPSVDIR